MKRIAAVAVMTAVAAAMGAELPKPQNIVLILADDLGWGDVSCYGAKAVSTPNVDRLAREGVRFTDAHAPAATCTPTRYALMTGEYAWRKKGTGIATGDAALLIEPGRTTLPSMLKKAGYTTGAVGKWHLGLGPGPDKTDWNTEIVPGPREIGFDYSFLIPATGDRTPCVFVENQRVVGLDPSDPVKVNYKLKDENYPGELDGRKDRDKLKLDWDYGHNYAVVNGIGRIGYMTGGKKARWVDEDIADTLAAKGAAFIGRNKDKPFFLYFATHDIHVPRVPNPRFAGKTAMGARGDVIVQFDFQVGEILKALDRLGLAEDTLVILSSDNGPVLNDGYKDQAVEKLGAHKPAGRFRGHKYSAYEGGTRVPFLVRWPKQVKAGAESAALVSLVDCLATFAALGGHTLAAGDAPDSFDVSAALLDPAAKGRASFIAQDPVLSLREGQWKFIPANPNKKGPKRPDTGLLGDPDAFVKGEHDPGSWNVAQLYDTAADPREANNLAGKEPGRVKAMAAALEKAKADGRTRATLPPWNRNASASLAKSDDGEKVFPEVHSYERKEMKTTLEAFFGYAGCIVLENGAGARVVLSPLAGGRVLEYSLDGTNALYLNPAQKGWRNVPGIPSVDPCGGRLDVGPEKTITPHPDLWLGDWTGEIVGEGTARLTSARDRMTGLRLTREFTLAPDSSKLTVEQRVTNESDKPVTCCHWSRTLAAGGGIVLIPLTPGSRFPKNYLMYTPEQAMLFQPVDPNIRVREGFLEILGTPKFPKLGMDSAAGWFSYLTRSNLLFTKKYPVYPDRVYSEMAGLTISIWYFKDEMCELEPIGPREILAPGASASFTETWSLAPMRFPAAGEAVDLAAVAKLAGK